MPCLGSEYADNEEQRNTSFILDVEIITKHSFSLLFGFVTASSPAVGF